MAAYQVENQWGGSSAPWNMGGTWILGIRDNQYLTKIDIKSSDKGICFLGTVTYNGEGPIDFRAKLEDENMYKAEVRWGGTAGTWHDEGIWIIGGRDKQRCVELCASADCTGKVLSGTMKYEGEGSIGFKGTYISSYKIENQSKKCATGWNFDGIWVLSGRITQNVCAMDIISKDCGDTFSGTMKYSGEGEIGFKGKRVAGNDYEVYNQWGGESAPWHRSGDMIIGGRDCERVIKLKFDSKNNGKNICGDLTYESKSEVCFRGNLINQIK